MALRGPDDLIGGERHEVTEGKARSTELGNEGKRFKSAINAAIGAFAVVDDSHEYQLGPREARLGRVEADKGSKRGYRRALRTGGSVKWTDDRGDGMEE